MWEDYVHLYWMAAKVMSLITVIGDLPNLPRDRVVLLGENHNLRNIEGKRFRAIMDTSTVSRDCNRAYTGLK